MRLFLLGGKVALFILNPGSELSGLEVGSVSPQLQELWGTGGWVKGLGPGREATEAEQRGQLGSQTDGRARRL